MTVKEIKTAALQLIDVYSENGFITSEKEPGKADYCLRIGGLIDQAVLRLITVYPKVVLLDFDALEVRELFDGVHYRLPSDFIEPIYIKPRGDSWGIGEFTVLGGELIAPYKEVPTFYYSALPAAVGLAVSEEAEPDVCEAGCRLIPLYVAGMLICEENPALSVRLMNQFEAMLSEGRSRRSVV